MKRIIFTTLGLRHFVPQGALYRSETFYRQKFFNRCNPEPGRAWLHAVRAARLSREADGPDRRRTE